MFLCDLVSSKIIVIPTIIFTIIREEVLILRITNKPKLLVLSHVILVYTRNSVYIFQIPGGKYINDIFSDGYPSTPQVEYAERVAVSDPTKCYYRSDGLIFMNIV